MRKLFITALIVLASFSLTLGQSQQGGSTQGNNNDIPNMGHAPTEPNGIGRLDLRVVDENGHPVMNAYAKLESHRSDGYLCESWNTTDARGVAVLPPIHMGTLTLYVKAKGYKTLKIEVPVNSLSEPVHVTLVGK
ncbi:MAG: carboxypeptidase-like regulatory domain-containing protein [Acidobacteriota bacterium]|nr:carboxypeptidase-like regulatory domain-containing protein [Acidobacteriota bacterium]